MSIPEHASPRSRVPEQSLLPEQHLLRDADRLQEYAGAFLNGDITAVQYSDLVLAEISRRAPMDPMEPLGEPDPAPAPPVVLHEEPPAPLPAPTAKLEEPEPPRAPTPRHPDADRTLVLARAFVGGRISGPDFLRLVRDC